MSWIINAIVALIGLFTGRKERTEEKLGATTATNTQLNAGLDGIKKANEAAKEVDKEHQTNVEVGYDPDDLDDPRNADKLRSLR